MSPLGGCKVVKVRAPTERALKGIPGEDERVLRNYWEIQLSCTCTFSLAHLKGGKKHLSPFSKAPSFGLSFEPGLKPCLGDLRQDLI